MRKEGEGKGIKRGRGINTCKRSRKCHMRKGGREVVYRMDKFFSKSKVGQGMREGGHSMVETFSKYKVSEGGW